MRVDAYLPKIRAVLPGHAVSLSVPLAEGMHGPRGISDLPLVRIVSYAGILHKVWAPLDPLQGLQGGQKHKGRRGRKMITHSSSCKRRYVHDVMSTVTACL